MGWALSLSLSLATASYRLLPDITLTRLVQGEAASRLAKCFSKGVIKKDKDGFAKVVDARRDTCSREVLRHEVRMVGVRGEGGGFFLCNMMPFLRPKCG